MARTYIQTKQHFALVPKFANFGVSIREMKVDSTTHGAAAWDQLNSLMMGRLHFEGLLKNF